MRVQAGSLAARRVFPAGFMAIAILAVAATVGWLVASQPEAYRPLFALSIASALGLAALRWPNWAILGTLLFLPVLALLRRLLIESSGWPAADPLLLIGPFLALVLFAKAYLLEARPVATDLLSKLVLAFLVLTVIGVVNPLGGGIAAGVTALMFTAVPLLWFMIGRALPDRRTIGQLQYATVFLAFGIAIYGICQTEIGFPGWDRAWIEVGGYVTLNVGGEVRAFGSLASSSEYAFYLGAGLVLACVALLHRRAWPLVLLPAIGAAMVLSAVRGVIVLAFLALIVIVGMRANRPAIALPLVAASGLLAFVAVAPVLTSISSESDLITHQLEGIAQPFDQDASTLPDHIALIEHGFAEGLSHPLGRGTAQTTLASDKFGSNPGGTEFDFSNTVVSYGPVGGLLFLTIFAVALTSVARNYMRTRDPALLGALGLAIVTFGFWLNGGHYALTPLIWLMLGWATRPRQQGAPARA